MAVLMLTTQALNNILGMAFLSLALWAVVNNAGIAAFTEIEWCSVDQFQRILDVNVLGVVRVTKAFLPLLRYSKGRVINVASLAGKGTDSSHIIG